MLGIIFVFAALVAQFQRPLTAPKMGSEAMLGTILVQMRTIIPHLARIPIWTNAFGKSFPHSPKHIYLLLLYDFCLPLTHCSLRYSSDIYGSRMTPGTKNKPGHAAGRPSGSKNKQAGHSAGVWHWENKWSTKKQSNWGKAIKKYGSY